jgi:large subunit ribosomal protein L5
LESIENLFKRFSKIYMRLSEKYQKKIMKPLGQKLGIKNDMAVPKIRQVSVNIGVGRHAKEKEYIDAVARNLAKITGQKAVLTKAKKSISAFKTRKGMVVGAKATLRGAKMHDFIDKLVNVTLPRVRDFRGLDQKAVDECGNLSLGFKEQLAFPEIKAEEADLLHGLEVNIATTAKNREAGLELFKALGFPFKK